MGATRGFYFFMETSALNTRIEDPCIHYLEVLKAVPFFRTLNAHELEEVAQACSQETFVPGNVVFKEGSPADKFYIIVEGSVEVWKDFGSTRQCQLGSHGRGHVFGEMALIDEMPRSATLVAAQAVSALVIKRDDFLHLVKNNGNLALSIILSISQIVRDSNEAYVKTLSDRNARLEFAYAELKAAHDEKLRNERLSTIGKFSSVILHDIRNPLAVIKVIADLLLMHNGNYEQVEQDVARLRREVARMERLAQEFLDYSRGEVRIELTVSNVDRMLSRLRDSCEDAVRKSGIDFILDYESNVPFIVDEERFLRVLVNLVENSRKAMNPGGKLSVHAAMKQDCMVFTIRDTGVGMSAEVVKRVYEPFYSESGGGGTGLGMLIVKNIVEAHEGSISIDSTLGVGTTVTVKIPVRL